jgi:hypothetical protein
MDVDLQITGSSSNTRNNNTNDRNTSNPVLHDPSGPVLRSSVAKSKKFKQTTISSQFNAISSGEIDLAEEDPPEPLIQRLAAHFNESRQPTPPPPLNYGSQAKWAKALVSWDQDKKKYCCPLLKKDGSRCNSQWGDYSSKNNIVVHLKTAHNLTPPEYLLSDLEKKDAMKLRTETNLQQTLNGFVINYADKQILNVCLDSYLFLFLFPRLS